MGILKCLFTSHDWSEWKPKGLSKCIQIRACNSCGDEEVSGSHDWGGEVRKDEKWTYTKCTNCDSLLVRGECTTCNGYGEILDMTMPGGSRGQCSECDGTGISDYIQEK